MAAPTGSAVTLIDESEFAYKKGAVSCMLILISN